MKKNSVRLVVLAAAMLLGCAVQQQSIAVPVEAARPLPITGRLVNGDPSELPPAVAMSLSKTSPIAFTYREELTHDEYHIPLLVTTFDPAAYLGAPVGDYGVTAFASLSITDGNRVIGDYTAKSHVTKSYSFYSEPTHAELDRAARAEVRQKIDQKLYDDADRLAQLAGSRSGGNGR